MTGGNGQAPDEPRCPGCGGPVEWVITYTDEGHTKEEDAGWECLECERELEEVPAGG